METHQEAKQMEKLVSSWYNNAQPLPVTCIFPPDARPGKLSTLPSSDNISVIDLGGGGAQGHDRTRVVDQILGASQEFGFFQVINHGIPENLLNDTMDVFRDFFALPPEDKASLITEEPNKLCRLITSTGNYDRENVHLWRDALRHPCHPLEKFIPLWPHQPLKYRDHVGKCSTQVRKLALRILELISEGLGIGYGHFSDEISQETLLSVNYYPPCPEPDLTLGITKHCDPNLITILLQGDVHGLHVFKDGEWIGVEPLLQGIVVNIGYQLQITSNGKLKCAEHRAVTNSSNARTSAAFFIAPSQDCHIEPAKALINGSNPQVYKGFQYKEFLSNYLMKQGNTAVVLEPFKLQI